MLVTIELDNFEKKFEYIGRIINYKYIGIEDGYIVTEWQNLLGKPHTVYANRMSVSEHMVREDKEWIKDIFEHLMVGKTWTWY